MATPMTDCTCITTCDQDLLSGRPHQHEDARCLVHPEVPLPLRIPESVYEGLDPQERATLEWGLHNAAYKLQRDATLAGLVDQLLDYRLQRGATLASLVDQLLHHLRDRAMTAWFLAIDTGPEEVPSVPNAPWPPRPPSSAAHRRRAYDAVFDQVKRNDTRLFLIARQLMLEQRGASSRER